MTAVLDAQRLGSAAIVDAQRATPLPGVEMLRGAVGASTIQYTLALTTQPSADVVIALTVGGTSGHSVSPSSLTFTAANWASPQTITVTITDASTQTDLSVVVHALTSADPDYDGLQVDEFGVLWPWRTYNPAAEQHATSAALIASTRAAATAAVFDGAPFPTRLPDSVTQGVTIPATYYDQGGTGNIARVDELVVNVSDGTTTWASKIWHFIPTVRVGRLAVVHQGHSNDLIVNGLGDMIKRLVETGYDVIALHMPGKGPNTPAGFSDHNLFSSYDTATFNPMRVFLEPVAVAINHAHANGSYLQTSMLGISGGGWTTLLYSALDTRVTRAYPIAGALPISLRAQTNEYGDWEQGTGTGPADFYDTIASYVDLYILAASGSGRRCIEIHNLQDSCCFGEYSDQAYAPHVRAQVASIGSGGEYRFYRDRGVVAQHTIGAAARALIVSDLSLLSGAAEAVSGMLAAPTPLGACAAIGIATSAVAGLVAVGGPLGAAAIVGRMATSGDVAVVSPLAVPAVRGSIVALGRATAPSPLHAPVVVGAVVRYELRGEVRDQGVLVNRRVRAHRRSDGALAAEADTSAGLFVLPVGFAADEYYLVPINLDPAATDYAPPCANRVTSVLAMDVAA